MAQKRLVEIVLQGKDESKGAFDSLANSLGLADAGALKLAAGAAAVGAAVVAAGAKVYSFTADMAVMGDEIEKLSARTGVAIEQLSEFEFALERGGGSSSDLEPAIRRLSRAMSDARDNIKEAQDAFMRLGISTSMLLDGSGNLRDVSEVLPMVAEGLKGVQSQAERMDIAQAILGRGGTMLLPMLQQGAEGIREMREEMERYGGAMSEDFAAKSAEFVDAQTNLGNAAQRLKEAVSEPFLAPFTSAVNTLAFSIANVNELLNHPAMQVLLAGSNGMGSVIGMMGLSGVRGLGSGPDGGGGGPAEWFDSMGGMGVLPGINGQPQAPVASMTGAPRNSSMPGWAGQGFNWWDREEMTGDIELFEPESMDDQMAMVEDGLAEAADGWKDGMGTAGEYAAATFQSAMSSAFAATIMDADNAAEAIAGIFKNTFAQLAGSLISAGIFSALGLPVSGPMAGLFGGAAGGSNLGSGGLVSSATTAMPNPITLGRGGARVDAMLSSYGEGFV